MSAARPVDPYQALVRQFNRRGIRYVVVGMSGINYYAKNAAETFATLDYDILLEPTMRNVEQAIRGLEGMGFVVGTSDGRQIGQDLRRVVRDRRTLAATTPDGLMIELLLEVSGFPFSEMANDAETFMIGDVAVKVGRLTKLLWSKKAANRDKDRAFLRRYQRLSKPGGGRS